MSADAADARLVRALRLSEALLEGAQRAQLQTLASLDAERLGLIKSFRSSTRVICAADRELLARINELNDRALGQWEHHRRSKGREMDMAAVGRRAVSAYSATGRLR